MDLDLMPHVLDEDELPFVIQIGIDSRPALREPPFAWRRSAEHFTVDVDLAEGVRGVASCWRAGAGWIVIASLGPILEGWWPILQAAGADPAHPALSAALTGRVVVESDSDRLSITVLETPDGVTGASCQIPEELGDELAPVMAARLALPTIAVALRVLAEFAQVSNPDSSVTVTLAAGTIPLADLAEAAGDLAGLIAWKPVAN